MATLIRSIITSYQAGDVARDYVTNTVYHHDSGGALYVGTDWTNHATEIMNLFCGLDTGYAGFTLYNNRTVEVRCYDMADAEPRPEKAFVSHDGGVNDMGPAELGLVLSYYAGRNIVGLRGRLFIGPMGMPGAGVANWFTRRPTTDMIGRIVTLGHGLFDIGGENISHVLHHQGLITSAKGERPTTYGPTKTGHAPGTYDTVTDYRCADTWGVVHKRGLRPTTWNHVHP